MTRTLRATPAHAATTAVRAMKLCAKPCTSAWITIGRRITAARKRRAALGSCIIAAWLFRPATQPRHASGSKCPGSPSRGISGSRRAFWSGQQITLIAASGLISIGSLSDDIVRR